ncbi:MAG TPA: hypothetical protein VEX35_04040 [Allosphingosinicella sp.]|nr:hypothetical protein [Allosphingosinicella sp.]
MSIEVAQRLYETGRAHALASDRLYRPAMDDGKERSPENPELFAFNGTYSLSIHYLIGLGLELMLKAAYVACGGSPDDKHLSREIGHDLVRAFELANERGFQSDAPRLREIAEHLNEPYKAHYFRYDRPNEFPLPDFTQMIEAMEVLDRELEALCQHGN